MMEAIEGLRERGFDKDFDVKDQALYCSGITEPLSPADLLIVEVYRFEGKSDPDDQSMVYAMEDKSGNKGIMIDSYGFSADFDKGEILRQIPVQND